MRRKRKSTGAAPGSYFLVMTHSHQLDETLTEAHPEPATTSLTSG
jgi:xanthine/CO dehydrogenase XdhC/CoxF family maturation factor